MSKADISSIISRLETLEKTIAELKTSSKPTMEKKECTKRGPSAWSLFIKHVTSEMKKENPEGKFLLPQIAKEAKIRNIKGQYDEAHWKSEALKLKDTSSAIAASATEATASESEVTATKPKVVRKKASKD